MWYALILITYTHIWIGGYNKFVKICTFSNNEKIWVQPDSPCPPKRLYK